MKFVCLVLVNPTYNYFTNYDDNSNNNNNNNNNVPVIIARIIILVNNNSCHPWPYSRMKPEKGWVNGWLGG